jgi:hypothetical protein
VGHDHRAALGHVLVAAHVVAVPVGVQDELHRLRGKGGDRRLDLRRERRELIVDHEDAVVSHGHADVPARPLEQVHTLGDHVRLDLDLGVVVLLLSPRRRGEEHSEQSELSHARILS